MVRNMKESFYRVINMERVFIHGKMEIDMRGTLCMIKDKDLVNIIGMMEVIIRENGMHRE